MLKRALVILVLALSGCSHSGQNIGPSDVSPLPEEERLPREAETRDGLKLEDLQVGGGPVAAPGRRLSANVEVRYTDGSLVYHGGILSYIDFVKVMDSIKDRRLIESNQWGIYLGLNGMRVGGRRRMTIDRTLVCTNIPDDAPLGAHCTLVGSNPENIVLVRKQTLIVEATLTESCNPVVAWQGLYMLGGYMIHWQACQEESFS